MTRYKVTHYGPDGESRVFTDPFDVPKGWSTIPPEVVPFAAEDGPEPLEGNRESLRPFVDEPAVEPRVTSSGPKPDPFDHDRKDGPGGSLKGAQSTAAKGRRRRKRKA